MEWVIGIVGGLGIGSLITAVAGHFMTRRAAANDRWYQEKRETYLGLLDALYEAAVHPSDEHSKAYARWQTRCQIFGSPPVSKYAQLMVDTNEGPSAERHEAFEGLIEAIRADLKAQISN